MATFLYNIFMKKLLDTIKDLAEILIISTFIVFVCFKFLFISSQVVGSSMDPALVDGDRGFSFIITKNIGINRFDICVIEAPEGEKLIVKRVIGLPNDKIEYKDNELYINGEKYEEPYLIDCVTNDFSISLGDDEYYCLGDNREISKDSRYYGPFKSNEIKSTKFLRIYPFNKFGIIK